MEERKIPKRYKTDIPAIIERWGNLDSGKVINTSLSEIFEICERDYKKCLSYYGLTNYLKREFDVSLVITSQKKK